VPVVNGQFGFQLAVQVRKPDQQARVIREGQLAAAEGGERCNVMKFCVRRVCPAAERLAGGREGGAPPATRSRTRDRRSRLRLGLAPSGRAAVYGRSRSFPAGSLLHGHALDGNGSLAASAPIHMLLSLTR
jgi:hypothetical protein